MAQDEWKATHNLKLTLALRVEHNSNPVCQTNCFSNLNGPFAKSASAQAKPRPAGTGGSLDVAVQLRSATTDSIRPIPVWTRSVVSALWL